jgi:LysM repeat protein
LKKLIAQSLVLLLVLSVAVVGSPFSMGVDTVSASTAWVDGKPPVTTPAPTTTPVKPVTTTVKPVTTVAVPAGSQVYVVVSGDAMWKIAAKYKLTLAQLTALNPQIKNPSMISVGQKVFVKAGATTPAVTTATKKLYQGLGYKVNFRNGPGADTASVPVYSFNVAMASAIFDENGKIVDVFMDGYEVATPNYDGASMPHFSGWPGVQGYNISSHGVEGGAEAVVTGVSVNTLDSATAEVNGWLTKRQRGQDYGMNPANEWYKQMDFFQSFFKGKTVAEVKAWFAKYGTSTYAPIKANTTNAADLAKFNALTAAEKAQLADVVSGATMRVNDAHGFFIDALQSAYDNRVLVK